MTELSQSMLLFIVALILFFMKFALPLCDFKQTYIT